MINDDCDYIDRKYSTDENFNVYFLIKYKKRALLKEVIYYLIREYKMNGIIGLFTVFIEK